MSGHWPRGRQPQNFPTSLAAFSLTTRVCAENRDICPRLETRINLAHQKKIYYAINNAEKKVKYCTSQ